MSADRAREEKRKIRLDKIHSGMSGPGWNELPEAFRTLITRSLQLQKRVERIDAALLDEVVPEPSGNPVRLQLKELAAALDATR